MIYRPYGKTGKDVSLLGFGAMRYGSDKKEFINSLHRAVELGVNYFDTAPGYGISEDLIGEAFLPFKNEIESSKIYFSTKSRYFTEKTSEDVIDICNKSLQRMKIDKINFFHMWCIQTLEQFNNVMKPGGPYEGALKLKEQGKIDHIVFSCHFGNEEIEHVVNQDIFEGIC